MANQPLLPFESPGDLPDRLPNNSERDPASLGAILREQVLPDIKRRMAVPELSLQTDLGTLLDANSEVGNQFSRKTGRHGALLRLFDKLNEDSGLLNDPAVLSVLESCARHDPAPSIRESLVYGLGRCTLSTKVRDIIKVGVEVALDVRNDHYDPNHASRIVDIVMGIGQTASKRQIVAVMFLGIFETKLNTLLKPGLKDEEGRVGDRCVAALTEWKSETLNSILGQIVRPGTTVHPQIVARACLAASPGNGSFGRKDLRQNLLALLDNPNETIVGGARQALVWFYRGYVQEFPHLPPNLEIPTLKQYVSERLTREASGK